MIVADMLFLSNAERGAVARRGLAQSLAQLAGEVVDYHEAALHEAGLQTEIRGDATLAVDAGLIRRLRPHLRPWFAVTVFALLLGPRLAAHPGVARRALSR